MLPFDPAATDCRHLCQIFHADSPVGVGERRVRTRYVSEVTQLAARFRSIKGALASLSGGKPGGCRRTMGARMTNDADSGQNSGAGTPLVLAGMLDISSAQQLQKKLNDALDAGGSLRLDARQVERVDACALQLLYACMQQAAVRGVTCAWEGVSAALCTAADLCGMREVLGLTARTP